MTRNKAVILVAWTPELENLSDTDRQRLLDNNIEIKVTGVGKINATIAASAVCSGWKYRRIINVGTAGSHTYDVGSLVKPTNFAQRDMRVETFGFPSFLTPGEESPFITIRGKEDGPTCWTGDNANGYAETTEQHPTFDVVEMEAYAIAKVCRENNREFIAYKYISDKAGEDAKEEFEENVSGIPWTQIIDEILA